MSDVFAPMPVKTKTAGDVSVNINTGQTVGLAAGSAKVGIVTTDQTTHGTTDLVASDNTKIAGTAIDVNSGTKSAGTQRVVLATDQPQLTNALKVDGSAVTQPVSFGLTGTTTDSSKLTSAALAAGSTATLDSAQIASGTAHLAEATVSSSVALKAEIGTWDGTTFTAKRTFFVPANSTLVYAPARNDEITMATGSTAKFRWSITNNDNANAADVYASITYYS